MSIFFTVVLSIWTAMHIYVFWRIASIPSLSRVARVLLILVAVFLWSSYVVGRIVARRRLTAVAAPLEWVGSYWLGIIFLIFCSLVVVDIISGFGYFLPALAPTLREYAIVAALALAIIALVQGARAPVITSYDVKLPGLSSAHDGLVIAAATDMHVGETLGA